MFQLLWITGCIAVYAFNWIGSMTWTYAVVIPVARHSILGCGKPGPADPQKIYR